MVYLPKNRYQILYTNGNDFVVKSSQEAYTGHYLELPNGYYAGDSLNNIGEELELARDYTTNIANNSASRVYSLLNRSYVEKEKNYTTPVATKLYPTEEDYNRGYMIRYFAQRIQTGRYFEISEKTSIDIRAGKFHDPTLYRSDLIEWWIGEDAEKKNGLSLIKLEASYPKLRRLFFNLTEFVNPK